jgi:hypothetical protein
MRGSAFLVAAKVACDFRRRQVSKQKDRERCINDVDEEYECVELLDSFEGQDQRSDMGEKSNEPETRRNY